MRKILFPYILILVSILISGCTSTVQNRPLALTSQTLFFTVTPSPEPNTADNFPYLEPITADNISQLELITTWGEGKIQSVDISSDGKFIALYKTTGVYIFDIQKKTSELVLPEPGLWHRSSNLLAFSPISNILAIAWRNFIKIYDVTKRSDISGIADPALAGYTIRQMGFSPDGKKLLVISKVSDVTAHCQLMERVQVIALYDIESNRKLFTDYACSDNPPIYNFQDSKLFLSFKDLNKEYKYLSVDWKTGKTVSVLETLTFSNFSFRKEDDVWTIYSEDKLICKTDENANQTVWKIDRQGSNAFFLKDEMFSVSVWKISNCKKTVEIEYPFPVSSKFRFDEMALIGINGNKIVSWNIMEGKLEYLDVLEKIPYNGQYVFSQSEDVVFVLDDEATTKQVRVKKINLEDGSIDILPLHIESARRLVISNDGSKIGIETDYDTLQIFDSNGIFVQQYVDTDGIYLIGLSPDGTKVALLSGDIYDFFYSAESPQHILLTIIESNTGRVLNKFVVSSPSLYPMSLLFQTNYAIAPNWKSFAIAHNGENQSFSAWDLENSKLLFKTSTKTDLYGIVYSPNSEILLTINGAGENSAFYFWSVENKSMLGVFMPFHNDDDFYYLQNVLFSPDGQLLIAQNNGVFYVWGIRTK